MELKRRERVRNAAKARKSFVTRRAQTKVDALADLFKVAAGKNLKSQEFGLLQRKLFFSGLHYLDSLQLIYNWENRFMSVNYNLQMKSIFSTDNPHYEETGDCVITLSCTQKGLRAKRNFAWDSVVWRGDEEMRQATVERLSNPYLIERLDLLDIMEMEIRHKEGQNYWLVSCESMIGSATWMLIPPILSMITPSIDECVKFLELYELIGDALINNKLVDRRVEGS